MEAKGSAAALTPISSFDHTPTAWFLGERMSRVHASATKQPAILGYVNQEGEMDCVAFFRRAVATAGMGVSLWTSLKVGCGFLLNHANNNKGVQ